MSTRPMIVSLAAASVLFVTSAAPALAQQPATPTLENAGDGLGWSLLTAAGEMRSGPSERYYAVARAPLGTVVRSGAARDGWIEVAYPAGVTALVMADEGRVQDGRVILTKPSGLRAENKARGANGSWRALVRPDLAAGTSFELVEPVMDAAGATVAYRVVPPASARAFVPVGAVRTANAGEVRAHLTAMANAGAARANLTTNRPGLPNAGGVSPSNAGASEPVGTDAVVTGDGPVRGEPQPGEIPTLNELTGGDEPVASNPTRARETEIASAPDTSLLEPMAAPPADASPRTPTGREGAAGPSNTTPAETALQTPTPAPGQVSDQANQVPDARPDASEPAVRPTLAGSDGAGDRSAAADAAREESGQVVVVEQGQPPRDAGVPDGTNAGVPPVRVSDRAGEAGEASASLAVSERRVLSAEELVTAFNELRANTVDLESSLDELIAEYERSMPSITGDGQRRATEARLEWLKLRRDLRNQRRNIAAAQESARALDRATVAEIAVWDDRAASYQFVGRITPSRVYDGTRLPLMYRIESVDPMTPGTLGYLRPTDNGSIASLVGQVVGVRGEPVFDRALKLAIIRPASVDRLAERP